jgi:ATP-dependent DNA ligase
MELQTLYARTNTGAVQQWTVEIEGGAYRTHHGQKDGKIQTTEFTYCHPKNLGKKNELTAEAQALKEAQAMWKKKTKEGYKEDIEKIDEKGFFKPQLCDGFADRKDKLVYPVAVEDKLNGIRCIFSKKGAFSRRGEEFFCLDHIKAELAPLFELWPDLILDGELFNPELKNRLGTIASLVSVNRKAKDVTPQDLIDAEKYVQYHVYDGFGSNGVTQETPFMARKCELNNILSDKKYCFIHKYVIVEDEETIYNMLAEVKKNNGEGLVIKTLDAPYVNKRSKNWMKLKIFISEEFQALYFIQGEGNWAGKVKKVVCKLNVPSTNGKDTFESNIRGSMPELAKLWEEREQHEWKQKLITVDFQEYSEYGVPLIPYCDAVFRDYE